MKLIQSINLPGSFIWAKKEINCLIVGIFQVKSEFPDSNCLIAYSEFGVPSANFRDPKNIWLADGSTVADWMEKNPMNGPPRDYEKEIKNAHQQLLVTEIQLRSVLDELNELKGEGKNAKFRKG